MKALIIGEQIRKVRRERGLRPSDLANAAGISVRNIELYEAKKALPSLQNGAKLAQILGVTLEYLMYGEQARTEDKPVVSVNDIVKKAHANAVKHGFYDKPVEFGTAVALMHSELSEALSAARNREPARYVDDNGKPEGWAVELADTVIRIADYCGYTGVDLESVIRQKMQYNISRPYKHNKAF